MHNEKSNDLIGNRTHDFPAYSIVPQPNMLPYAPLSEGMQLNNKENTEFCAKFSGTPLMKLI
jgi:hypothetical protein